MNAASLSRRCPDLTRSPLEHLFTCGHIFPPFWSESTHQGSDFRSIGSLENFEQNLLFPFFPLFFLLWSKNTYCVSFSSSSLSSFLSFARIKIRFKSFVFFSARKSAPVRFWNAHILDFRVGWKFSSSGCNKADSDSIPFYFERFRSKSETSSSVSTTRQQCQSAVDAWRQILLVIAMR